jgi:tRNA(Ile)-lysidine synthase
MSGLINKVLEFADEYEMLPDSGIVLVSVSGGADSMCLLEAMRHISYERVFDIAVAHYNHELRGEESDRDETFVMEICEEHGIPFYSGRGNVAGYARKRGLGIEEAARDMRYEFLFDTAGRINATRIATAHNMDDNAETMLINLARGAGANGMSGIPPIRDAVIRPLLRVSRKEVLEFIAGRELLYVDDSTNSLDIYTRNKVRHKIIPLIEEINPRFNEATSTAAQLFRADEEFISDIAELFIQDCCIGLTADAADLAILPFSVSSRVIRKIYSAGTQGQTNKTFPLPSLSYSHVRDVLALCGDDNPSASISLPGMIVYREYNRVIFDAEAKPDDSEFAPIFPTVGNSFIILGLGLKITCKTVIYNDNINESGITAPFSIFLFKSLDICGKITVRPRREGDCIRLNKQSGTKTLKKLFIEKRIPARKRALVPVISDDEGVLGIYGLGIGDRAIPETGDTAIQISFEEIQQGDTKGINQNER